MQRFYLGFDDKALEDMMCRDTFCLIKLEIRCKWIINNSLCRKQLYRSFLQNCFHRQWFLTQSLGLRTMQQALHCKSSCTMHYMLSTLQQAAASHRVTPIAQYKQALSAAYTIACPFSPRYCFPTQCNVLPSSISHSLLLPKALFHFATCYTMQAHSCCLVAWDEHCNICISHAFILEFSSYSQLL